MTSGVRASFKRIMVVLMLLCCGAKNHFPRPESVVLIVDSAEATGLAQSSMRDSATRLLQASGIARIVNADAKLLADNPDSLPVADVVLVIRYSTYTASNYVTKQVYSGLPHYQLSAYSPKLFRENPGATLNAGPLWHTSAGSVERVVGNFLKAIKP